MALRVKCRCGKILKIGSELAGKKLTCPGCGKPFRVAPDQFAGQEGRASVTPSSLAPAAGGGSHPGKVVSAVATMPAALPEQELRPAELDIQPANLDLDTGEYGFAAEPGSTERASLSHAPEPMLAEYAGMRGAPLTPILVSERPDDVIQAPKRGFWADAFASFAYPFASTGNTVSFIIVLVLATTKVLLRFAGILGGIGGFIIFGWMASLYLSIVQDSAAGSEDMPSIKADQGIIDDIVKPAIRYIGAMAIVLLPAFIFTSLTFAGYISESLMVFAPILMVVGVFFWPMVLLLMSTGLLAVLGRPDLILTTILKTLPAYLALWLMLLVIAAASLVTSFGPMLAAVLLGANSPLVPKFDLTWVLFVNFAQVYLQIVAMRMVGLYYLHWKNRFTFTME